MNSLSNRTFYPCLSDYNYLNQASLGLIGEPAVQAMNGFLNEIARFGNIKMSDQEEVQFFDPLRKNAAQLFDTSAEQVAILSSASEMLAQLPYIFKPKKNSKVLVVSSDFPAITRPWISYSKHNDCSTEFVKEIPEESLTDTIISRIDHQTSVVAVSLVQFSTGTKVDVYKLRQATKKIGSKLILDVTQAAGVLDIKAVDYAADVLVCSGYKWLGGHGGVGLAVLSKETLKEDPILTGWMGTDSPFDLQPEKLLYANDARKFTQSTMSYISIKGLETSIKQIINLNIQKISEHSDKLAKILSSGLKGSKWGTYRSVNDQSASSHIVSLQSSSENINHTLQKLKTAKIVCGTRNNRLRISIAHFNNEADINSLINALS